MNLMLIKIYKFSKFIDIFFDYNYKFFLLKFNNYLYSLKIPSNYFIKIKNFSYEFLFLDYFFFLTFIKIILK